MALGVISRGRSNYDLRQKELNFPSLTHLCFPWMQVSVQFPPLTCCALHEQKRQCCWEKKTNKLVLSQTWHHKYSVTCHNSLKFISEIKTCLKILKNNCEAWGSLISVSLGYYLQSREIGAAGVALIRVNVHDIAKEQNSSYLKTVMRCQIIPIRMVT